MFFGLLSVSFFLAPLPAAACHLWMLPEDEFNDQPRSGLPVQSAGAVWDSWDYQLLFWKGSSFIFTGSLLGVGSHNKADVALR